MGMGRRNKRKGKRNNSFQNALGKADLVLHAKQGEKWNYCVPLSLKAPESSAEISGPKSRSGGSPFHGIRDHHLAHFLKATIVPPWCSPCVKRNSKCVHVRSANPNLLDSPTSKTRCLEYISLENPSVCVSKPMVSKGFLHPRYMGGTLTESQPGFIKSHWLLNEMV